MPKIYAPIGNAILFDDLSDEEFDLLHDLAHLFELSHHVTYRGHSNEE